MPYACVDTDVFVPILCTHAKKFVLTANSFIICAAVSLQGEVYDYEDETYEDPQPLNCSTTESIRGGHVTYSEVKKINYY